MKVLKELELKEEVFLFENLDQLVLMLKDEYEVTLKVRKKGELKTSYVKL